MIATPAIQHQPWCRDHCTEDDHPEQPGWCHHTFLEERADDGSHRTSVNIQPRMHDSADAGIDVYTDDKIAPDEARRLAAALLRAADVLEGASRA
ncbi:hypothetical protein [Lapillicoccus jejuensis]|uniref:Uncharacterized protein n=1 Tax=Lapillicoccus jejuensis TaxID=402171 RepID=A0A542DVW9_9MICO|nr:hypothetical protein [Lapillicoccus jejuensis]TQJ07237.1 hypothetical protein FB458_0295 [Lapillicoccus jejuensis]